jgi:hypothetical protein
MPRILAAPLAVTLVLSLAARAPADIKDELPKDVVDVLKGADKFELYTLDPKSPPKPATEKSAEYFHGWKIVDHKAVGEAKDREKLVEAFIKGVRPAKSIAARGFAPRHGLRVTRDKRTVDLLMSFEHYQSMVYEGDVAEGFTIRHTTTPGSAFDMAVGKYDLKVAER